MLECNKFFGEKKIQQDKGIEECWVGERQFVTGWTEQLPLRR